MPARARLRLEHCRSPQRRRPSADRYRTKMHPSRVAAKPCGSTRGQRVVISRRSIAQKTPTPPPPQEQGWPWRHYPEQELEDQPDERNPHNASPIRSTRGSLPNARPFAEGRNCHSEQRLPRALDEEQAVLTASETSYGANLAQSDIEVPEKGLEEGKTLLTTQ